MSAGQGVTYECSHPTCFEDAVYELRIQPPATSFVLGSRIQLSCANHVESLVGRDHLVSANRMDGTEPSLLLTDPFGVSAATISTTTITTGTLTADRLAAEKRETAYRPTRWSTPWLLLIPLFGWELWAVITGKPGGPLSHLVWWAYGERYSLRWWVVAQVMNGLGLWAAAHFMFEWPDWRHLLIVLAAGAVTGLLGWGITVWFTR